MEVVSQFKINEFVIIVGYNGDKVKNYINKYIDSGKIKVTFIENSEWKRS